MATTPKPPYATAVTIWKLSHGGLVVPYETDLTGGTCLAPGPLGDPGTGRPRRVIAIGYWTPPDRCAAPSPMPPMQSHEFGSAQVRAR